ncbi:MAG: glutamate-5-semialdehyde dehydrogenase [Actinobacteria bacterium]|uniref:glutamate-5-semialdehyde dehydrogenase n=1 Tax=freshwater metagenome TaxID=449393 RepID=A0A6J5Z0V5_9ZZZZ|nr:glutamate-5-semialdehyde dehydrogenase [Actinomycetota bacterium]
MDASDQSAAQQCAAAKAAAPALARASRELKDAALMELAESLERRSAEILAANALDLAAGEEAGLSDALLDRLRLDRSRISAIADGAREVARLDDPVGELLEERELDNGLHLQVLRAALGVVAVVYEARPNVTIDAAGLCIKSGNACVLRGSATAERTNAVLASVARDAVVAAGLPAAAVTLVGGGREQLAELATQKGIVDLIIPRGGEGLKAALEAVATVPVLYAASGNCHVYVDRSADLADAVAIAVNSKVQRPGVCNAAETLLVHRDVAASFIPLVARELLAAGVELRVDEAVRGFAGPELAGQLVDAVEADWETEFLDLIMAVRVVDSLEQAIEHIALYGSGHSEAIVTADEAAADEFRHGVDAACIYVNASTRFTDGAVFGMGSEIGISTQKLHARGPIGLRELCTIKYVVTGDGHVRA